MNSSGQSANSNGKSAPRRKRFLKKKRLVSIVAIVIIVGALVGAWFAFRPTTTAETIDDNKYQAVFLTNGQVYFGKLATVNAEYMRLSDIYYLQTQSANRNSQNPQQTSDQQTSGVQLIKLGEEIHGPVDEMVISRDQILFFENLKEDSQVSASIKDYQTQPR
ncbi:MAG TPA: hypothetical protein VFX86_03995 [Candidatus Saccharimonadales bacterium]|nr:hypothetical protein [Candidatus Saccharimonadales bacterium]